MKALRLAWLRFARRRTGLGGIALLVAVAQAALVLVFAARPSLEADAVRERTRGLDAASRWISIQSSDPALDRTATRVEATALLSQVARRRPTEAVAYRPLSDARYGRFQLVGSDALASDIELSSGRLAHSCDATRCEVVLLEGGVTQVPPTVVVVGRGRLRAGSVLSLLVEPGTALLASSRPDAVAGLPAYGSVALASTWSVPVDVSRIASLGLDGYLERLAAMSTALDLAGGRARLVAPSTQFTVTRIQVQSVWRRMLAAVLGLLLLVLFGASRVASAQRGPHARALAIARQYAFSPRDGSVATVATSVLVVMAGWCIGEAAGALGASRIGDATGDAVLAALPWSLPLLASCTLVLALGLRSHLLAPIAMGVIGVTTLAVAAAAGLDATATLIAGAGAALAAMLPFASRRVARAPFLRNFVRASHAGLASMFVVGAFIAGFAMASIAQLQTLDAGAQDRARFQSPLAERVLWGDRLPLQGITLRDYSALSGNARVWPVRKLSATVHDADGADAPAQIVGVDPRVWLRAPDLSRQTGVANATLASVRSASNPPPGVALLGARVFTGRIVGLDPSVFVSCWLLDADGQSRSTPIEVGAHGAFSASLPAGAQALIGFTVQERPVASTLRAHAIGEGRNAVPAPRGWVRIEGARLDARAMTVTGLRWQYSLIAGPAFHPLAATPTEVAGVVDAATAASARDGVVPVRVSDDLVLSVHVVAAARRLPTVGERFVMIDSRVLDAALAARAPENLRVSEVWLERPIAASSTATARLQGLTELRRADVLAADLASSASTWSARGLRLLVALMALLFLLIAYALLRDIAADWDLDAWIAQGSSRVRLLRAASTLVSGGSLAAAVLGSLAASVLFPRLGTASGLDIAGVVAVPPLVPVVDVRAGLVTCAVAVALTSAACAMAFRRRVRAS